MKKDQRVSLVFRGYKNETPGTNGLKSDNCLFKFNPSRESIPLVPH